MLASGAPMESLGTPSYSRKDSTSIGRCRMHSRPGITAVGARSSPPSRTAGSCGGWTTEGSCRNPGSWKVISCTPATEREPTYQDRLTTVMKPITAWPGDKPITFPTKRLQLSNNKLGGAFRYMGRSLLLQDWLQRTADGADAYLNQDANSDYKLTALGYGEPAFAAYYPNCYSVFGFCDVDPDLNVGTSYDYQVIGWFNEADLDPLQSSEFAGLPNDADRYAALQREYRWCLAEADRKKAFPIRTVCYASLRLTPNQVTSWPSKGEVKIAIGNTGGEALSALLADEVAAQQAADKTVIEDQLEAMNLAPALQGVEVDYPAHFAQTRHQRGFRGIAGGNRWAVLPKRPHPVSSADANRDAAPQPPLPDAVAHALDALNTAQEAYNMAQQEIVELCYQTFCDWHKFFSAYYSNAVDLQPFRSQSGDLGNFIAQQALTLLNEKIVLAGTLVVKKDTAEADGSTTTTLDLRTNALTPIRDCAPPCRAFLAPARTGRAALWPGRSLHAAAWRRRQPRLCRARYAGRPRHRRVHQCRRYLETRSLRRSIPADPVKLSLAPNHP